MHEKKIRTVSCSGAPETGETGHTYQLERAFRIRLAHGLDCSKAVSTFSPVSVAIILQLREDFHRL